VKLVVRKKDSSPKDLRFLWSEVERRLLAGYNERLYGSQYKVCIRHVAYPLPRNTAKRKYHYPVVQEHCDTDVLYSKIYSFQIRHFCELNFVVSGHQIFR
jgi:hypothetical protein